MIRANYAAVGGRVHSFISHRKQARHALEVAHRGRDFGRNDYLLSGKMGDRADLDYAQKVLEILHAAAAPAAIQIGDVDHAALRREDDVVAPDFKVTRGVARAQGELLRRAGHGFQQQAAVDVHPLTFALHACSGSFPYLQRLGVHEAYAGFLQNLHGGEMQLLDLLGATELQRRQWGFGR